MDEDRSKAEKIIKACEYLNTIIGDPVEKACCKGLMERVKELEMERERKCREILHFDAEEELECQKKHHMKPVEKHHIVGRYGTMSINPLSLNKPDRNFRIWEDEMFHLLHKPKCLDSLYYPRKSWLWLNFLMEEEISKSMSNNLVILNYDKPSETMTLNDVIHWNHVHTDFIKDIKYDKICGFPKWVFSGMPSAEELSVADNNKTELERVIKRRNH